MSTTYQDLDVTSPDDTGFVSEQELADWLDFHDCHLIAGEDGCNHPSHQDEADTTMTNQSTKQEGK